jgi:protoporphyrinogen oxidase/predicted dehydrogenase
VSSDSILRIGVVGLGYWGPNLARNIVGCERAELTWACDLRPKLLEAHARRYPGTRTTTSYEDLLNDPELDAVAIATPVSTHHELAAAALDAGKHVFIEKPLSASTFEGRDLVTRAEQAGLVLMPGHTFLYSPPVLKIKELLDAGALGDVYFISMSRVNLGLHQPDVSVVWDLGPHDFSILRFWLGMLPTDVSALTRACVIPDIPDVAFVNARFDGGAIAHLELSWLSPSKLRRTAIVGSEKMVVYDDTQAEPVRIFDSGATLPDPETFGEFQLTYRTGDIVSPKLDATEPLALEILDFCSAVLDGSSPRSSVEIGLDVVKAIEAVERSLDAGGMPVPVDVPDTQLVDELAGRTRKVVRLTSRRDRRHPGRDRTSVGTAVLGAGPAGLTAAYTLAQRGEAGVVLEADSQVGGISKTVQVDGYRFDLGGHRFFTKLAPVQKLWEDVLGEEMTMRPRLSRIYYDGKFFEYPITAKDVVGRLGVWESTRCAMSYLWAQRNRAQDGETFEEWVTQRFGRRLYDAFFRSYTEKVWGIPGSEIRSLWAAQRIKNFSLFQAMLTILGLRRNHVTTLIEQFRYPRLGPGQMWEAVAQRVGEGGIPVRLGHRVSSIRHRDGVIHSVVAQDGEAERWLSVDGVLTSLPLADLVSMLEPAAPEHVLEAARGLRYRDFCLVALMTSEAEPFPDNWIYLHDPETRAGRVQNYGAWSDGLVRPGTTCLGVEYFCFEGDEIWEMSEDDAIELAKTELGRIGLIDPSKVFGGAKVRVPKAYPMYDASYEEHLSVVRGHLAGFANLRTCGRNGLHRYNNQDHSMWTAVLATLNLLDGTDYDVWSVNTEAEYHEEGEAVDHVLDLAPPPIGVLPAVIPTLSAAEASAG